MEVKASLRHLRIAPRKVRLVIGPIKGKTVQEAERQLMHMTKLSARPILKLLQSAKASAKNNFDLDGEAMYIKSIIANEGTTLKRYMPKAYGKADVIRKRATHVYLVLEEVKPKDAGKSAKKKKEKQDDKKADKKSSKKEASAKKKPEPKKKEEKKAPAKKAASKSSKK